MRCDKKTYKTKREAIRFALLSSRAGAPPLRVYPCKDCQGFHLTKRPGRWRNKN